MPTLTEAITTIKDEVLTRGPQQEVWLTDALRYEEAWMEIVRLANLGEALEKTMPMAAELDGSHHANLACRCLRSGDCGDFSWYVYKQSDQNEALPEATIGRTAQEALDNWNK